MGFVSNFVGNFKHASFATEKYDGGKAITVASSQVDGTDAYQRVERKKIEQVYLTDPQTFNTIDLYVSIPMNAGFKILAENKTNQKQYEDFFKQMGRTGMQLGQRQFMARLLNDAALYGYSYSERIFSSENGKTRIVDLKPIDAKLMDYARNQDNVILVDAQQKPIGYTMKVGYGAYAVGDPLPKGIKMNPDQIFLAAERIACILFKPFGNGFESYGVVEPAILDIERKQKIKTAVANTIHNSAAYPVYAIVGDQQQKASKQVMENTLTALQNFSYNRFGVFPHPTQLNTLPIEHSPQADEHLRFLRSEQSTAGGIALGITVGSGEAINRQTMSEQQVILDMKFDGWLERFSDQFNKQILDYLYKYNGYGSKAELKFNDISLDDKIQKTDKLLLAIDKKVVAPEEVREFILQAFDLKEDKLAYKKHKDYDEMQQDKQDSQDIDKQSIVKKKTASKKVTTD